VESGESPEAVAAGLGINRRTIYRWLSAYPVCSLNHVEISQKAFLDLPGTLIDLAGGVVSVAAVHCLELAAVATMSLDSSFNPRHSSTKRRHTLRMVVAAKVGSS
jgi:hypothetical protein